MDVAKVWAEFESWMPGGFAAAEYAWRERGFKVERHERFRERVLSEEGRALLDTDITAAVSAIRSCSNGLKILSKQEHTRLGEALKDGDAARRFIGAVLDLVDAGGRDKAAFEVLVRAARELPAEEGRRVDSWPVVTIYPYLATPRRAMFLKPVPTQSFARRFGATLRYDSRPNWQTYEDLLRMSDELLEGLRPHGARDLIDVQSVIWVVEKYPAIAPSRGGAA